ncbi:MAG: hypothetical protein ACJA0E_000727, partial [Bermanella sp.]
MLVSLCGCVDIFEKPEKNDQEVQIETVQPD